MALIKCKECGKEYSDRADTCPNCSCPTKDNISPALKSITPIPKIVGYMRKSIECTADEVIITEGKNKNVIPVSDINGVHFCLATFSSNGFLTICTKDGTGHSTKNANQAKSDCNSILFNQPQNKKFQELSNMLTEQLAISISTDGMKTSAQLRFKQAEDEREYQAERIDRLKKDHVVFCPKCKSQNITYVDKKLSIRRAFVGNALFGTAGAILGGQSSKKGSNKCMNCGYAWKI